VCATMGGEIMTKSEIERAVASVVERYHREQQGHGPSYVQAHLVENMILVRCQGVFTPTEVSLTQSEEGRKAVQSARRELRALTRRQIEAQVAKAIGTGVSRSYYDLDVRLAEQVEVYMLEEHLESRLQFERLGLAHELAL
ncbi:MAG: DUF2294 domain-containing protein, partial [Fimbriimonas sp.]